MQIVKKCKTHQREKSTYCVTGDMSGADRTWLLVNESLTVEDFLAGVYPLDKVCCNLTLQA